VALLAVAVEFKFVFDYVALSMRRIQSRCRSVVVSFNFVINESKTVIYYCETAILVRFCEIYEFSHFCFILLFSHVFVLFVGFIFQ
jgi:hypothetical protein